MERIYVGADGGGTKTRITALGGAGREIVSGEGGSLNYNFIDMDEAVLHLADALNGLNLPRERIAAVSVGNPAMDDEGEDPQADLFARKFARAAGLSDHTPVYLKSDVFMALYGLTRGKKGALVVGGTGSMGLAADGLGRLYTVGGWGRPTSDDGSALYIAVEGLSAVFRAHDNVGPQTALLGAAQRFFGADSPRGLIGILNDAGLKNSGIAAFSTGVSACADSGDAEALRILTCAGGMLAGYAVSLLKKIGAQDSPLGVYGGVLLNCARVRRTFDDEVKRVFPNTTIKTPEIPPERAAAFYAMDEQNRNARR